MLLTSAATHDAIALGGARRGFPAAALKLLTDERLARLAAGGDRAAFAVIFDRHQAELYRYCTSILRNSEDAADALQNAMLRALHALEGDTREIALRPWLYRIAHNEAISLLRRRTPATDANKELSQAQVDVEADLEVRAELGQILDDIRELPERQRGALVMREMAGLEYPEIAAALATSPAGAKQAIYEARCALHDLAKGRDMDCEEIQRTLSDGDGRAIRGRALRAHLRACTDCRDFSANMTARRSKLAALAPAMPASVAARMLQSVLGGGGGAGGASQLGLISGLAAPAAVKGISAIALVIAAGAGATQAVPDDRVRPASAGEASTIRTLSGSPDRSGGAPAFPAQHGPKAQLGDAAAAEPAAGRGRSSSAAAGDTLLPPSKPGKSRGRVVESDTVSAPTTSSPTRPPRRPVRNVTRPGGPGRGGTPVRDQVNAQVDEVRNVAGNTVGGTVETVREALPVKPPKLPLLP